MKTKKIAKILGLGLAAALAFSLGAGIGISPASADVHEWSTITTPSWEDNVIEPGSDIYDYAVSPDGETIVAVGGVDVGFVDHDGAGGNPTRPSNLHGAFFLDSNQSVTITNISSDTAEISASWDGEACFLFENFTMCGSFDDPADGAGGANRILFSISGEITGNPFDGLANDTMEFSGMLYSDGASDLSSLSSSYSGLDGDMCVDGADLEGVNGTLGSWDFEGLYTQPRVWLSDDGGVTWTNITADVQDASNLPAPSSTSATAALTSPPTMRTGSSLPVVPVTFAQCIS